MRPNFVGKLGRKEDLKRKLDVVTPKAYTGELDLEPQTCRLICSCGRFLSLLHIQLAKGVLTSAGSHIFLYT